MKNKVGRPLKIDDNILGKLKEAFLMGCTDAEACLFADINPDTLYEFQKKNPKFSEQKEGWKKNPVLKAKKTIFDNLDKVATASWYLERKCKDEFLPTHKLDFSDGSLTVNINREFVEVERD